MVNSTASNSPPPSTPRDSEKKKKTEEENKSGKKMKQTRLSFASKGNVASPDPVRKRKLSSPETEQDRSVKIVRREEEEDEKGAGGDPEASIVIPDDDELVEIIPCDDSNSAAPEEDTNDVQPLNESTNLDNNSSESPSDTEDADKTAPEGSLAASLEPPTRTDGKPLTPRQLEKFLEKKKRFEERQKQKLERDKKLEEEKRQKEEREKQRKREREEKEEQRKREKEEREAARLREKEEKETAKQREKEEKETAKLREKEQKNEEKRRKEEQKEEERRRKEEEKRAKELEEEAKKKKAAQAFSKFFKVGPPKVADDETGTGTSSAQQSTSNAEVPEVHQFFMPFQVKGDMKLAPTVRRVLDQGAKEALEKALTENVSNSDSYLKSLKSKTHVPLKGSKTLNTSEASDEDSEDDLMVVDDELAHKVEEIKHKDKYRAKRLMFHENRRPAYYGTWQKSSKLVGPRRPFAKDEKFFDYEVDSDEEWEEEEPGESLHGSDDEKDKESEDDYEVDNEFFVPHGHLSDEEMQNADEPEDNTPEAQKAKLKILQDEFNDEMKKKTEKIKPRLIGCIWANETGGKPDNCPAVFWELLQFRAILSAGPIQLRPPPEEGNADQADQDADAEDNEAGKEKTPKKKGLADEEVRHLIRLVHGNPNSRKFMVKEFQVFREKNQSEILSGISIARKIKEIAKWETPPACNPCWVVQKEFLEQFQLVDLPVVNQWEYSLTPKGKDCLKVSEKKQQLGVANSPQVPAQPTSSVPVEVPRTPTTTPVEEKTSPTSAKSVGQQKTQQNGIARFAKVLTTEEKQRQFQAVPVAAASSPATVPNENKAPTATITAAVKTKAKELGKESPGVTSSTKTPATGATPPTGGGNSVAKKRVPLLMSVPRGQAISEQSKNLLISNFLKQKPEKEEAKTKGGDGGAAVTSDAVKKKDPPVVVVGEPIVLD